METHGNQVLVNAHLLLANLGSDAYLLNCDLDEFLVTDNRTTLPELAAGCFGNRTAKLARCAPYGSISGRGVAESGSVTSYAPVRLSAIAFVTQPGCTACSAIQMRHMMTGVPLAAQDECRLYRLRGGRSAGGRDVDGPGQG